MFPRARHLRRGTLRATHEPIQFSIEWLERTRSLKATESKRCDRFWYQSQKDITVLSLGVLRSRRRGIARADPRHKISTRNSLRRDETYAREIHVHL